MAIFPARLDLKWFKTHERKFKPLITLFFPLLTAENLAGPPVRINH